MGLPFALKEAGFILGLVLLVCVALITDYSLRLLARLSTSHCAESYQELMMRAFGSTGFVLVELAQFAFAFGALVAYLLIIRDTVGLVIRDLAGFDAAFDPRAVLALVAFVIVLPICFLKTMAALSRFSAVSMLGVLVMVLVVLIERFRVSVPSTMTPDEQYVQPHSNWLSAIGGFSFAFVCQHQLLLVIDSMRRATTERVAKVVHSSLGIALLLSMVMAVAGYTIFFEFTDGDILKSFEKAPIGGGVPGVKAAITAARICLTINMALTYPAELMVCRHVLHSAVIKWLKQRRLRSTGLSVFDPAGRQDAVDELERSLEGWPQWWLHVGLTVGIFLISLAIALAVEDLGIVQELAGSVSAVLLAFVFPAAVHLKLGSTDTDTTGPCHSTKIGSFLLMLLGVAVFFASTAQTIMNAAEGEPLPSDDPAVG